MEVHNITNIVGWIRNGLLKEFRTTYDYENGNDVTIVERRIYTVQLYTERGELRDYHNKGNQIDTKA